MKKIIWFLCTLLLTLMYTCSLEEGLVPDPAGENALKAAHGAVITVDPSGGDDTQALIEAFAWAKGQGPGSSVQLSEGEFHIGLIQVDYFYGTFAGAGKGKTVIIPLTELDCGTLLGANLTPTLLKFFGGDIKVEKMSFRNPEGQPCEQCEENWAGDLWCFLGFFDWASGNVPPNNQIKAAVDQVEFSSNPNEPSGYTRYGVMMAVMSCGDFGWGENLPYSNSNVTITNCDFKDLSNAYQNLGIESGKLVFTNNTISGVDQAIWLQDNIGGTSLVSGNEFNIPSGGTGVIINNLQWGIFTYKLSNGCQYEISGNKFFMNESWAAMDITDGRKFYMDYPDNNNSLLLMVKNNLFDMQNTSFTGIWNYLSQDAVIRNNKFTGQATGASLYAFFTFNCLMLGNNFSNMFNTEFDIVMLGSNNTVIGGNHKDTKVLDLGEYNVITGVTVKEGEDPVGQTIKDNYLIMRENMKKMRRP